MVKRRVDWSGAFVVMVTPFREDGALDESATRRLIDMLVDEGADGIIVAGSTGEWFTMSDDERVELFRIAANQNRKRIKLLAGSSAISTRSAVMVTTAAKNLGFDGTLILPPPYVLPTERELLSYFEAVDTVGLPMMLYNNPTRTGINLDARLLSKLLVFKHIVALKDSAKDLAQISATLRAHRRELAIFTGFESYVSPCVQRGAVGVVAMTPNIIGREAINLFRFAANGEGDKLVALQDKIDRIYDRMYGWQYNPYVVIKEAMRILGRPGGWARPPLLPLTPDDRQALADFLRDIGALPQAAAQQNMQAILIP
jgi:4-hydroxy-tetrahydrodipicolinate synthase